jgi:hypothetical protein
VLIEDPHRFDGVRVIGVDEHCWRHARRGDKYLTVIIDLTPIPVGFDGCPVGGVGATGTHGDGRAATCWRPPDGS